MGACTSYQSTGDDTTKEINDILKKDQKHDKLVTKLLFLGPGDSGKSTIYKQLVTLYGRGYKQDDRVAYVSKVHANVILAIQGLIEASEDVCKGEINSGTLNCKIDDSMKESVEFLKGKTIRDAFTQEIVDHVNTLWQDQGIRNTFAIRDKFQYPYDPEYFFTRLSEAVDGDYIPSFDDLIHCRSRTTGILEASLNVSGDRFHVIDVGGQRNERSKWIHCFEDVTGMIFVTAISEYDQVLFEDERINRMHEALFLFDEVANSRWFVNKSVIVFLNKSDLFREKIKRVPFASCPVFEGYDGPDPPGEDFDGAVNYIRDLFRERCRGEKSLYIHITCATNTANISNVFQDTKDIIARAALVRSGIV